MAREGVAAGAVEDGIRSVLEALNRALTPAVAQEAAYFSAASPALRLITMGAEGADFLGTRAAAKSGLQICHVVPFPLEEYRNDFSPSIADAALESLSHAASLLVLPGRRDEGPRAYERANEIILSNIDFLVAVWDGGRARGRAGTGDVVQSAVNRGLPVIVIDPQSPAMAAILAASPADDFEPPVASDLARSPLPRDLTDFVRSVIAPPRRLVQRQALADLIAETPRAAIWRYEYPFLLRFVAGRPAAGRTQENLSDTRPPKGGSPADAGRQNVSSVDFARKTIDGLAVQYGRLFRSSSVSQYLVVIIGVWVSGTIGLLVPSLAGPSIAVQLLANALVLADSALRARHRWQERWLDYRVIAERLRWLGFRYAFGLGAGRPLQSDLQTESSWTDWYLQRMARALGPPHGRIDAAAVKSAADYLTEVEIPDQIGYHRRTFRQLGLLERRLAYAAHGALAASLLVAVLLAVVAVKAGSLEAVGWKPLAILLLADLPATMTGLNGLRVDADLVRLVERSAQSVALLSRIRRVILAAPRDYDHVASNMQRLASLMGSELAEWRFVIESRRSRTGWRQIGRKRSLFRSIRKRT